MMDVFGIVKMNGVLVKNNLHVYIVRRLLCVEFSGRMRIIGKHIFLY